MKLEAKVGLFVLLGIILLFAMSTQIAQLSFGQQKGYTIHIALSNANGLNQYGKVRINGVDSGFVSRIYLQNNQAHATLFIYENVSIPNDSAVVVTQESMLGGRYIEIIPGNSNTFLQDNQQLTNIKVFPTLDQTTAAIKESAEQFQLFISHLNKLFDNGTQHDIQDTLKNIHLASQTFAKITEGLAEKIDTLQSSTQETLTSIQNTSNEFFQTATLLNNTIPDVVHRIDSILQHTDEILTQNKEPLQHTIQSIDGFFTQGRSAVNRIDNYLSAVDRSQIELGMRAEYLTRHASSKGVFSLNYLPSPTRYYMGEIIGAEDYSRADSSGNPIPPKQSDDYEYYFSAQLGKRYGNWLFRGGIIESSGGVGLDYYALQDNLKMTVDIYDMGSKLDLRGSSPHVRAYVRYTLLRYIDAFVGWDNMLNSNLSGVYLGIGLRFIDNDIKPLMGTIGGALK